MADRVYGPADMEYRSVPDKIPPYDCRKEAQRIANINDPVERRRQVMRVPMIWKPRVEPMVEILVRERLARNR